MIDQVYKIDQKYILSLVTHNNNYNNTQPYNHNNNHNIQSYNNNHNNNI